MKEEQRKGEVERMKNIMKKPKTGNKRNNINSISGNNNNINNFSNSKY